MRMHPRKTAWALVLLALLFVFVSAFFPAHACHHNCTGDDCPVCMQIRTWAEILRVFGAGVLYMLLVLSCWMAAKHFAHHLSVYLSLRTPVALKIKLLN